MNYELIFTIFAYILGGSLAFVIGVYCWVVAKNVQNLDGESFKTNSVMTGGLKAALLGELVEHPSGGSDAYCRGIKLNTKTGALTPCRQLSSESIKRGS